MANVEFGALIIYVKDPRCMQTPKPYARYVSQGRGSLEKLSVGEVCRSPAIHPLHSCMKENLVGIRNLELRAQETQERYVGGT